MSECTRNFGETLQLADLDLSTFQDAVTKVSRNADLQQYLPNAVAFLLDLLLLEQREMEVFGCWYHDMIDLAVFGTEDDPIIIDE